MESWECDCGQQNATRATACLLCERTRGAQAVEPPEVDRARYFRLRHEALIARLQEEGVVFQPIHVLGVSGLSLARLDGYLLELEERYRFPERRPPGVDLEPTWKEFMGWIRAMQEEL